VNCPPTNRPYIPCAFQSALYFSLWFLSLFCGFYLSSFFLLLFSLPNLSGRRLDVYHTSTHGLALANLECKPEMCYTRLAENTGRKNDAKNRHLRTIAQICRALSSQLRHVSTIGKKFKRQCLPHMSSQYGALRPTSG